MLRDAFGREFDYLRISLTDRCNLRCFYCTPEKLELLNKREILTLEEIAYLVSFFYRTFGIRKVRLTGGEPLLRRGIEKLVTEIRKNHEDLDFNITTNGILLKEKAELLRDQNVKVNVSLDTLNREKFQRITGFDGLDRVIEGIDFARSLRIPLKINTVVLRGINDDEIFDLIEFARERKVPLRLIEYMPLSDGENWRERFVPEEEIRRKIEKKYALLPAENGKIARNYRLLDRGVPIGEIGFISTISSPFCCNCSRLRITADGKIVLCLFDERGYDLKEFLRPWIREKELVQFLKDIVKFKPEGYIRWKREGLTPEKSYVMRRIGG